MIEINLLPHREARRVADLRESVAVLGLGLVLVAGGIYFVDQGAEEELGRAQNMVRQLEADIKRYRPQEAKVKKFRVKREQLEDKLAVIDSLEKARSGPVRILDELSRNTPERLWVTDLSTAGRRIEMKGESIDTGVVADFLRNLNSSTFFRNVDLDRTEGGKTKKGVKLVNFVITANLANPMKGEAPPKKRKKA